MKNIFVRIRLFIQSIRDYKAKLTRETLQKELALFKLELISSIVKVSTIEELFWENKKHPVENVEKCEKYQKQFAMEKSNLIHIIQHSPIPLKPCIKYILISWKLSTYSGEELEKFLDRMTEIILLLGVQP